MARPDTEELYDRYLDACLAGEAEDLDSFCRRNGASPNLKPRLAALQVLLTKRDARARGPRLEAERGLPFERLGEFRLIRRFEKGGMGTVYLAEQESLGRPVALKVVRPELQDSPTATERFRREAVAVGRLQHPNIVRVHAIGEDQGVRYIAMELVPGRPLDEVLAEGTPATSRVVRWMLALARALHSAHAEGVIHRDIKPSNIRITPDDVPMLIDFGIARDTRWKGETLTQAFTGSPLYAAPEQLAGRAVDARVDVYALGATLYQCLTGRVPFEGDGLEQVFARALNDDPVPPRRLNPSISRDLELITLKMLAKRPGDRYESAAALADDLEALIGFRPIRARPPSAWDRFRKWCRRRPAPVAVLATILLALLVAAAWSIVRQRADARGLVAQARATVRLYRQRGDEIRDIERRVTKLKNELHARFMTREEEKLLETQETAVARSRRERQEAFHEVFDLLRRAQQLDADVAGVDGVRAAAYFEKWKDSRAAFDRVEEHLYRDLVRRYDRAGRYDAELRGGGDVYFFGEDGADVYAFRIVEQADVVPGGEHRLVPVPVAGEPPVPPGTWALRVVRGAADVACGDVILEVAGHPIRDTVVVLDGESRGDRVVDVDGVPVYGVHDLETLADTVHTFRFAHAEARRGVRLGARCGTPAELAEQGNVAAKVHHLGEVRDVRLPPGLSVRTTAAPLFLSAANRIGTIPFRAHLDGDPHQCLVRKPGFEDQIITLGSVRKESTGVRLRRSGSTPPGFVYLCGANFGHGSWMMEREVTAGEYLEFLNDPATLRRIDEADGPKLYPRTAAGPAWHRVADRFVLPDDWTADMPVLAVNWYDAMEYARWRTARARAAGRDVTYSLPTRPDWIAAGHGMNIRDYPFGFRFRPKWVKSNYSRRTGPCLEPVMRFPIDESPYGVYDMAGSAQEWLDDWFFEEANQRRIAGGSWGNADPELFKLWGSGAIASATSGTFGFRLVMREGKR